MLAGVRALVNNCASDPDFRRPLIFESREPDQRFVWMFDSYFRQMVNRGAHFIKAAQELPLSKTKSCDLALIANLAKDIDRIDFSSQNQTQKILDLAI